MVSEKVPETIPASKARSSGRDLLAALRSPGELLNTFKAYFGLSRRRREPVDDRDSFRRFIETRASFIAQTSLYGYLRTRAGQRYPDLFDDDAFVVSINIAKWQIWLACLGDLGAYAGGMLLRQSEGDADRISGFMASIVDEILDAAGEPEDAGEEFTQHAALLRQRIVDCDWKAMEDGEGPFSESPGALVRWAPIVDSLKQLDEPIVRNSVRFRWQEVRREFRRSLDVTGVLGGQ